MPRLLFVAYWVPPRNSVGSIRARHLLRYLPEFGWDVTTITPRFNDAESNPAYANYLTTGYWDAKAAVKSLLGIEGRGAHEALNITIPLYGQKRTLVQRAISSVASIVSYPDDYIGWLPFAVRAIRRAAASANVDAILTTAPPMTANLAVPLSRCRIPWIADFRDLWAGTNYTERSQLQMSLDGTLERTTLSHAAALTASSEISAQRLRDRYPRTPCFAISTGFDPEEWEGVDFTSDAPCTLLYAGHLYRGKRDPSALFKSLTEIFEQRLVPRASVRVDFYTLREQWLIEMIAQYGLDGVVRVLGLVDRKSILAAQRRADRLLILCWDGEEAEGIVPGKLFEHFGARRPILAIGGPVRSNVADLLRETGAGKLCLTTDDIKREVLSAVAEHAISTRIVPEKAVSRYTGRHCASRFAEVLNLVLNKRTAPRP